MTGTAARFARLMSVFDGALVVVTAVGPTGERSGCLVGFATQCSIDPPRFLACLSVENHTYRTCGGADRMAVHLVPADRRDLAAWFGGTTGDEVDTFGPPGSRSERAPVAWHDGPGGVPLVEGCPDWFVGSVVERVALGDHVGFVLSITDVSPSPAGGAVLRLRDVADLDPGHEP